MSESTPPTQTPVGTLSTAELQAIAGGYHGAPAHLLGMHLADVDDGLSLVVRVFRPLDEAVGLIDLNDNQRYEMEQIHPAGIYELLFLERDEPFPYRLEVTGRDGSVHELEDPYRLTKSWFTDYEVYLHGEGNFYYSYQKFGAHVREVEGVAGVQFAVWAPNALRVSVIGPFNGWDDRVHPMHAFRGGIWEIFIPGLSPGEEYKYSVKSQQSGYQVDKSDPYGFYAQVRPGTASRIWQLDGYAWQDDAWLEARPQRHSLDQPLNIYEVHLGSWRRDAERDGFLSYRELAQQLVAYVREMGYTHIELLPITEHPYDGSWGYQTTGYFAPTSRFGSPDDFKFFVDTCHQSGIGVILDWVPAHFPKDAHGLAFFDGTHLYEHADPRQGEQRDWGTKIFNFGRNEVRNFLLASALFWVEEYHLDGLRVDAVASMLYLDYSRDEGDWIPNRFGGRENLEAIHFLRQFNEMLHQRAPGVLTIAEESTSWPMVSRPTYTGGLGFDYKWNMGWMHDTLEFFEKDPIYRNYHLNLLTFSLIYAFSENFILPFSHDEVVHLKKSMLDKMPGDLWQKFANLRLLMGLMTAHPGKKLLFMGAEFGQWREWNEAASLDWHLLAHPEHRQLQQFVKECNRLYQTEPAFHQVDTSWEGFQWIDFHDVDNSVLSFLRRDADGNEIVVACNCTPVPRMGYRLGLPGPGAYAELLNSDWQQFGGSGICNDRPIQAEDIPWQSGSHSAPVNLPPLGVLFLKPDA